MSEDKEQQKIKKIREYVLKSGLPSEVEVGNILRKNGWLVVNQLPYIDKAEQKMRAVDVSAAKLGLPPPMFSVSLLIECKKSAKHDWVFYTQRKTGEFFPALVTIADFLRKLQKPPISDKFKTLVSAYTLGNLLGVHAMKGTAEEVFRKLSGLHILDENIKTGISCVLPPSHKDDFFEAVQQIDSAMEGMVDSTKSSVVFPVIVFDGELYELFQENNEMIVLPINHIQFMSFGKGRQAFLIDVVRKSYFLDFLTIIERDFQILKDFIETGGVS